MAIITGKTAVTAGNASAWSSTDGVSNILVGVNGADYTIEYNLGSDLIYGIKYTSGATNQAIVVAKANQVRVRAGIEDVNFEVFG